MNAIPTRYNGVQFRSRLEARWAAFFDLAGWRWEYEPLDLSGYIPDFILMLHRNILVEVKPSTSHTDLKEHLLKIETSGWDGEALIVGAFPLRMPDYTEVCASLGYLGEGPSEIAEGWGWGACIPFVCGLCGRPSFQHPEQSFHCRACGGNEHYSRSGPILMEPFDGFWSDSGNKTQWRGVAAV